MQKFGKISKDHKSPFTWIKDLPLEDLEKPESIKNKRAPSKN